MITGNPHLNPAHLTGLAWVWGHAYDGMYNPVVFSAWWSLIRLAGKPNAQLFHASNLAVHFSSVILVFFLLRRLVQSDWPAAAGTILFAIHPLQVEPVVWAAGMKDLLSSFFALASLWAYLQFVRRRNWLAYTAATGLYFLALLAKPSMVTLPLIAAALEYLYLSTESPVARFNFRRPAILLGPWVAAAAIITVVATSVQPAGDIDGGPLWARPLIAADALAFYLWKLVWPLDLAIHYGRTPHFVVTPSWHGLAPAWITWILPAGLAVALAYWRRPALLAAAFTFAAALLPVLGLHKFSFQTYSTVADRYVYLAMLGPALAAAWLVKQCPRRVTIALAALGSLSLAATSFVQAGYWIDTETLYRHSLSINFDDFDAHHNIGLILAGRDDVLGAMQEYQTVIAEHPDSPPEYRYVADALTAMGDWPAAADYAKRLIEMQPKMQPSHQSNPSELHCWLGGIYLRWAKATAATEPAAAGKTFAQAKEELNESLRLDPANARAAGLLADAQHRLQ